MASSVIRRTWFGWANPSAPNIATGHTATASAVVVKFASAILPASPAIAQFAATVNGTARGVTAAACAGSNLTLTLASAVTAGQTVVVTYTPGASPLRNAAGDLVSPFSVTITAT